MNLDRAQAAQRVLSDECVKEAFDHIEADILAQWRESRTPEAREAFWHDMGALMRLKAKLKSFAGDALKAKAKESR